MLGKAIAELAPLGLAAALSPLPVIAVVLLLSAPAGPGAGVAFAGGWLAGLAGVTWALAFAAVEVEAVSLDLDAWTRVAIGLGLLAAGGWKWATRPRRDRVPKPPRWIASLAGVSRGTALLIGVVFGGPNPKNLALAFVAGATMAEYGLEGRRAFVAGAGLRAPGVGHRGRRDPAADRRRPASCSAAGGAEGVHAPAQQPGADAGLRGDRPEDPQDAIADLRG